MNAFALLTIMVMGLTACLPIHQASLHEVDYGEPLLFDDTGLCADPICEQISSGYAVKLNHRGHIVRHKYHLTAASPAGDHADWLFGYFLDVRNGETLFVHKNISAPSWVCNLKQENCTQIP